MREITSRMNVWTRNTCVRLSDTVLNKCKKCVCESIRTQKVRHSVEKRQPKRRRRKEKMRQVKAIGSMIGDQKWAGSV